MLASNTILQNRYRIVRQLGQGGMGTVYEAIDERLDTTVALKECHFTDEQMRKQFKREARLLARLRHPAMTRVIDHFTEGDGQFLVMDFIPGEDLWEMLRRHGGAIPPKKVLEWADQLLDALHYLHKQEPAIIHRDIKPQNLKMSHTGEITLLDFGLAKGFAGQISRVTTSGSIFGYTPNYAPLEQIQGTGTDPRSDLYSLAATLYNLITGKVPPDALSRATAIMSEQPDPLRPANEVNEVVTASVANALHLAMSNNPAKRPTSAVEMRSMLRDAYKNLEPVSSVREKAEILPPTIYDLPPTQRSQELGFTVASPIAPSAEFSQATVQRREAEEVVLRVAREREQREERERQQREVKEARRKAEIRRQREEAQRNEEEVTRAQIEDKKQGEPKSGQEVGIEAPAEREDPKTQVSTSAIITNVTLFVSLFLVTMLKPRFWQTFDGYIGRWTLIILFATGLWRLFARLRDLFKSHSYQHRLIYSITKGEEEIEKSYSPLSIAAFLIIGCTVSIAAGLLVGEGMHYAWSNYRYFFDQYPHPDLLFYPPIIVLFVDAIQRVIILFRSSERTTLFSPSPLGTEIESTRKYNRLSWVLEVVRKRLWIIVGVCTLITSLTALYLYDKPNMYEAKAMLRGHSGRRQLLKTTPDFLLQAIKESDKHRQFGNTSLSEQSSLLVEAAKDNLRVEPIHATDGEDLIEVRFQYLDPEATARFVNAVADGLVSNLGQDESSSSIGNSQPEVSVVHYAALDITPVGPHRLQGIIIALFSSLALSIGFVLLLEYLRVIGYQKARLKNI